jgi:hypothetical protein
MPENFHSFQSLLEQELGKSFGYLVPESIELSMIIKKCLEQSILTATNDMQQSPVPLERQSYVTAIVSGLSAPEYWQSEQTIFDFEFEPNVPTFQFSMSGANLS